MKLAIRKALFGDVPRLWELRRQSILELAPAGMTMDQSRAWAANLTIQGMEKRFRETEVWIAEMDDAIVGWVAVRADHLVALYADPRFARKGIGSELLGWAEGLMREAGIELIRAEASPNAEEFYLRRGYEPAGLRAADGALPLLKRLTPIL
ncbi:MAG: putative acetyltransferase [Gammaproteobacteria bacterium]|nr:putative acetyltransferase [Gammaproteobacteria bacterium]